MTRVCIGTAADFPPRSVTPVSLPDGQAIALYHLDDGFFATDLRCSHGEASLADGEIDGGEIICPFHRGRFDIRSGAPRGMPCVVAVKIYVVLYGADGSLDIELA